MINKNLKKEIYKNILRPIIFLDLFSFPLTAWEIWHYLDKERSLLEIENTLKELVNKNILQQKYCFYFLFGREKIINIRNRRYNYSVAKLKKARFFSRLFSLFPGVMMVAAANLIGSHNWCLRGDIDLFIITKKNYLWRSRLFCAGIAKLLNSRPTSRRKQDKICLSFYISEAALDLRPLSLPDQDPYFDYWRRGLFLLYDSSGIWRKFLEINDNFKNKGEKKFDYKGLENKAKGCWENLAKKIQLKIIPPALRQAMNFSKGVVITDDILKLYLRERRRYFREIFNLKKYEIFKNLN